MFGAMRFLPVQGPGMSADAAIGRLNVGGSLTCWGRASAGSNGLAPRLGKWVADSVDYVKESEGDSAFDRGCEEERQEEDRDRKRKDNPKEERSKERQEKER